MPRYRILPRGGREYVLESDGTTLGTLALTNLHGTRGSITLERMSIPLARKAAFRKHVHLEHPRGTLHFQADTFSRGAVVIDGRKYEWRPANIRWTEWTWHHGGARIMSIRLGEGPGRPRGIVSSERELASEEELLLALFGWYLLLLNHQTFGMHLLHAVTFATAP